MRASILGLSAVFPILVACNVDQPAPAGTDVGSAIQADTAAGNASKQSAQSFDVDFKNCHESIGVGLVPTDVAQSMTPDGFVLVGTGSPVTPLVVRTSHCESLSFDGGHGHPVSIVEIGAVVVPPDGTGDINNYAYWYYTDDRQLSKRLEGVGVPAQHRHIDYDYDADDTDSNFHVSICGVLSVDGTVDPSTTPDGSFDANWWKTAFGGTGTVKMATFLPVQEIGSANLVLSVPQGSAIAGLTGTSMQFPLIQQFNTFPSAHMAVTVQ